MFNKKNGLSRRRSESILRCFCADHAASQTALLRELNRKTVNRYFGRFRAAIAGVQPWDLAAFTGVIKVDEGFFGAGRIRGHPARKSVAAAP